MRGQTSAAIAATEPASAETRAAIAGLRHAVDNTFAEVAAGLRAEAMPGSAQRALQQVRPRLEAASLAQPASSRPPGPMAEAAAQEIARNVAKAASGTSLVTLNVQQVSNAAGDARAALGELRGAITEVASMGERLRADLAGLLDDLRAAA